MGYRPASERAIAEAERRLGTTLPPSLKTFYRVTNGWRAIGYSIYGIRPVQKLEWLRTADPDLYGIACEAESPSPGEPAHMRAHHFEQGTRVKRSLLISSGGDAALLLLDPETRDARGEWAGGQWAAWSPGMEWSATSFAGLLRHEKEGFLRLRDNKPLDYGLTRSQAKQKLKAAGEKERLLGVLALQGTKDPRQATELLRTYRNPRAGGVVREMAIRAACELKSREAYEQAIHDMPQAAAADDAGHSIDDGGDEVRPSMLFSAILAYGEDPTDVFARWLEAPSPRLRQMSLGRLGHCRKSPRAREILLERLRHPDVEQREAAAYALTQLMDEKTAPALIAALTDPAPNVRSLALHALLPLNAREAVPAIEALARRETDAQVLAKIDFVLPALKPKPAKQRGRSR
jgi:HEAT repeat protein